MSWSAKQYLIFEDERTRPVRDLLASIVTNPVRRAIDLGCGPGNSTEVLAARFPEARIQGLDSSPDMIAAARRRLPKVAFQQAEISAWLEGPQEDDLDLILANAVFQWIPDHVAILTRLVGRISVGGSLAVQMPDNLDQPSHRMMREAAVAGPWADKLKDVVTARADLLSAEDYYDRLRPHFGQVEIWRTTYYHPLSDAQAIIDWVKGTGLRPFLEPLNPAETADFLKLYRTGLEAAYPPRGDGRTLLAFPRLFIVARR